MKVAITGATGFVGRRLVQRLAEEGDRLLILTRNVERARRIFPEIAFPGIEFLAFDPIAHPSGTSQITLTTALTSCDGVVNLAGEPIAETRWTPEQKNKILTSRQQTTRHLVTAIREANPKPSVLVSASAIGYYGASETASFDEESAPGQDFLSQVCQTWEAEAQQITHSSVRLVIVRIGIVLGPDGGALAKLLPVFRLFAGGPLGTGNQWMSWIHRDDLVNLIHRSLHQSDYAGVLNGTAPQPVRMKELCQILGAILNRPSWLPVPEFALELLLGEGAMVVLEGQQVLPRRTQSLGFGYHYPSLDTALKAIIKGMTHE